MISLDKCHVGRLHVLRQKKKHGTFWIYVTTTAVCSAVARTPAPEHIKSRKILLSRLDFCAAWG